MVEKHSLSCTLRGLVKLPLGPGSQKLPWKRKCLLLAKEQAVLGLWGGTHSVLLAGSKDP